VKSAIADFPLPDTKITYTYTEAEKNGLKFVSQKEKNRWAAVKFIYPIG
jgi:hypothetical protein